MDIVCAQHTVQVMLGRATLGRALIGLIGSLVCTIGVFSPTAHADAHADAHAADAGAVVVFGTRIPTPLDHFGGAVSVVTAADIQAYQYRDITDALASVPGLHLSRSAGLGGQASVFMRGAESNHVLVLIDGVEVTDPASGGTFAFEHLQLQDVERIEVLRGPYSAQYGSEGIGGVIHITTRRGEGKPRASARVEGGSLNSAAAAVNLSGQYDTIDFSLGSAWLQSDGESATPRRLRDGEASEDDGYDNLDVKGAFGVALGDASRLDFNFGYVDAELDYDAFDRPFEVSTLHSSVREKRYSVLWSGDYLQGMWRPSVQGAYYSRHSDETLSKRRGERTKFEWRNELFLSDTVKFAFGAETELEKMRGAQSARTQALYAQAWLEPFAGLSLSGGFRRDDADDFASERSGQLAATYVWGQSGVRLRTAYGTAFKAPTLNERFGFGGNPDLAPETSRSWEFGVDHGLQLGDVQLEWGVLYFDNRIRNMITFEGRRFQNLNLNSAHIEGLESFAALQIADGLSLHWDHTITRAYGRGERAFTCQANLPHFRLLRRPLRKTTLAGRWSSALWSLTVKLDYVGPRHDCRRDDFNALVTAGGYTLAHMTVRRQLGEQLALFARVNNLLDRDHQPIDGFAGRGLELHAGVEAGF